MDETDIHAEGARGGDEGSLVWLYERLAPALHAWARLRLRGTQRDIDSDDLVQEVWIRALDAFSRFEHRKAGSFRAWMFTIAANVYIELMRRSARQPANRERTTNGVPAEITSITQAVKRREELTLLVEKVAALDLDDRRLFMQHALEGQRLAQVALDLGISAENARKRWQRLRRILADDPSWKELIAYDVAT